MMIKSGNKMTMTTLSAILFIFIIFGSVLFSEEVRIYSSVCCWYRGRSSSEKPAENIVVIPKKWTEKANCTDEGGEFTLLLPRREMNGGVLFTFIGESCTKKKKTIHFNPAKIKYGLDAEGKVVVIYRLEEQVIKMDCSYFEPGQAPDPVEKAEACIKNPYDSSKYLTNNNIFALPGGAIQIAMALAPGTANPGKKSNIGFRKNVEEIPPEPAREGIFLYRAYAELSQNTGFNFTPDRDLSEAVFWNPSAILLAFSNQASLYTDWSRYLRFSTLIRFNRHIGIAAGLYRLHFNENGTAPSNSDDIIERFSSTLWTAQVSAALRVSDTFYFGLSYKQMYQESENANVPIEPNPKHDFDISFTYLLSPNFRVGFNAMNVLNTKLRVDDGIDEELKAFGFGAAFQGDRIQLGSDIRIENDKVKLSFGASAALPISDTVITIGIAPHDKIFSFGVSYKNLHYSYNHNIQRGIYHLFGTHIVF